MTARIRNPNQLVTNHSSAAVKRRVNEAVRAGKALRNPPPQRADGTFKKRSHKYKANGRWIEVDFIPVFFDSAAEADRYEQLKEMAEAGTIDQLEVHPTFQVTVNGHPICKYEADFRYRIKPGRLGQRTLVEDVKGMETAEYKLKRKLVHALGLCDIIELKVSGNIQRYRYLTADQFHTAKDQPDAADDQHPVVGRADA